MYKAKNGFILADSTTPDGWIIRTAEDIITALLTFPAFQTVAAPILAEQMAQAIEERKEYANIKDFAEYLAAHYI